MSEKGFVLWGLVCLSVRIMAVENLGVQMVGYGPDA